MSNNDKNSVLKSLRFLCITLALFLTGVTGTVSAGNDNLVTAQAATREVRLTAFTKARTLLHLSSEVSGRVSQLFSDIGDRISNDGRVLCLDDTFTRLDIAKNRSDQALQKVDIDYFNKQVNRYRKLVTQNSSAQIQLDDSERNLQRAHEQLEGLKIVQRSLNERLQRHCLYAPAGWLMADRLAEQGQWLNIGDPAATVGDYSQLLLSLALTQAELQTLQRTKDSLSLYVPDLDRQITATIKHISPAFDPQSRKTQVELQIDARQLPDPRGGLRVELVLRLPLNSGSITLPRSALITAYDEYWLEREDGSKVRVTYLGELAATDNSGEKWVQLVSDQIRAGDRFKLIKE